MGPIRGQTRPMPSKAGIVPEAQHIDAKLNASIHNRFDIEVIDAATGKIKQRAQAENVICNALWTRILTPTTYFNYIHYGTGAGTPAASDTSLFTFSGYGTPSTAQDVYSGDYATGVASLRRKIQLSETTAVGVTITEVGIGYGSTAATLCTHALLKDMSGNAISIAKTATDIINIYATIFIHYNAVGYDSGSIRLIPHNTTGLFPYLFGLDSSSPKRPPSKMYLKHSPSYFPSDATNVGLETAYNTGSKAIVLTASRVNATTGNMNGVEYICLGDSAGNTDIVLAPSGTWMNGTNIVGEAIGSGDGVTKDFNLAFAYASEGAAYVDGVAQSGVTFSKEPKISPLGMYFVPIFAESSPENIILRDGLIPYLNTYVSSPVFGTDSAYFYNPFWEAGVASHKYSVSASVYGSNDMNSWILVPTGSVAIEHQHYKFWHYAGGAASDSWYAITAVGTGKAVHFATPPATGAALTCSYHTGGIAKDANHVFDLTVTIQLGEYTT